MSGPLGRLIAQIVVAGFGVASKAFVQAYQQAIVNAKSGRTAAASQAVARRGKMQVEEALQILNLEGSMERLPPSNNVKERYERYFKANDPAKGGSFYLQSKIYRAQEALELARQLKEKEEAEKAGAQGAKKE